jgi:hypothetical protein
MTGRTRLSYVAQYGWDASFESVSGREELSQEGSTAFHERPLASDLDGYSGGGAESPYRAPLSMMGPAPDQVLGSARARYRPPHTRLAPPGSCTSAGVQTWLDTRGRVQRPRLSDLWAQHLVLEAIGALGLHKRVGAGWSGCYPTVDESRG